MPTQQDKNISTQKKKPVTKSPKKQVPYTNQYGSSNAKKVKSKK